MNPLGSSITLLAKYLRPHWRKVLGLGLLLIANIALQLINPQLLRHFIDTARSTQPLNDLVQIAVFFVITAVLGNIASGMATYMGAKMWHGRPRISSVPISPSTPSASI